MPGGASSSGSQSSKQTDIQRQNQDAASRSAFNQAQNPTMPDWLGGLLSNSGNAWESMLAQAWPQLSQQLQATPEQVAPLSSDEQSLISSLVANAQNSPYMNEAQNFLGNANNFIGSANQTLGLEQGDLNRGQGYIGNMWGPGEQADLAGAEGAIRNLWGPGTRADLANAEAATGQIGGAQSMADIAAGENQLNQLTGGPIGSSPATQAAMRAYQASAVPQLESGAAMAGAGRGGGIQQALQQGQEQAYVPLVQQEIANRQAAASQYGQLGSERSELAQARAAGYNNLADFRAARAQAANQEYGNLANFRQARNQAALAGEQGLAAGEQGIAGEKGNLANLSLSAGNQAGNLAQLQSALQTNALQAADMPRQIQQQQFENAYQDMLRRYGLQQQVTLGPMEQLAQDLFGTQLTGTSQNQSTSRMSGVDTGTGQQRTSATPSLLSILSGLGLL